MPAAYLETLNPQQRRAAEHGVEDKHTTPGEPLLIIAGAGSGKTNTLAHRVAHLIVNGADPRRILLMTFSRRAAAEMTRSVERITRQVVGNTGRITTDALTWAGTFHVSALGCCANTPTRSVSTPPLPSTIEKIPPI
jgi:DNA helicase-2/ATP-dependent DNA helicase PcrA